MKAIIGITCSEKYEEGRCIQFVNQEYIEAIEKAGGRPLLLPISESKEVVEEQLERIDGLLIPGGYDVNPLFYHESCQFELDISDSKRDYYEIQLLKLCSQKNIPILGICRGLQIINVAFGGTLYQDNQMASEYVFQHQQKERREFPTHSIRINKDSFLAPIFNDKTFVNSMHHQSIKKLAEDFRVVARSEYSIIEAIQHNFLKIYGVQFHPECMIRDEKMQKIFDIFVYQCNYKK